MIVGHATVIISHQLKSLLNQRVLNFSVQEKLVKKKRESHIVKKPVHSKSFMCKSKLENFKIIAIN